MSVIEAMELIRKEIEADEMYAWTWHCNIAVASQDEALEHGAANRAAARFMYNCWGVDTSKLDVYKQVMEPQHD